MVESLPGSSPFDALPSELISIILVHLYDQIGTFDSGGRLHFPTRTRLVSQRWNQLVRDTPELWTFIYIRKPPYTYMNEWLALSGALPLDVVIEIEGVEEVEGWLDSMIPHVARWRCVRLLMVSIMSLSEQSDIFHLVLSHATPIIRTLEIAATPIALNRRWRPLGNLISAPSLTSFNIAGFAVAWNTFRLSRLEELTIQVGYTVDGSIPDFLDVVERSCETLRILRLKGSRLFAVRGLGEEETERLMSSNVLKLHRLNCLELWGLSQREGVILLSIFKATSLLTLHLELYPFRVLPDIDGNGDPPINFPILHTLRLGPTPNLVRPHILKRIPTTLRRLLLDGGSKGTWYQDGFNSLLDILVHSDYRQLRANICDLATRRVAPQRLRRFLLEGEGLASLASLHVWSVDLVPSELRTSTREARDQLSREVNDLKKVVNFQVWKDDCDSPWPDLLLEQCHF